MACVSVDTVVLALVALSSKALNQEPDDQGNH